MRFADKKEGKKKLRGRTFQELSGTKEMLHVFFPGVVSQKSFFLARGRLLFDLVTPSGY